MPKSADLLNHARDVGGTYEPGRVGTGRMVLSPVLDTTRKRRGSLAHLDLPALGHLSMPCLCLEEESNKEKMIPFSIAAGWLLVVPGQYLYLYASICLSSCTFFKS